MEDSIPGEEKNVWEIVAIVQLLSHVQLFATQWTVGLPVSSAHGIL